MPLKTDRVLPVALLAVVCVMVGCQREDYEPRVAPIVPSTQLTGTTIVPTLDTPLTKPGNAVWCATFQAAWNRACGDVIGGPLQITNAQAVVERLNRSPVTEAAMPPGSYYVAAGRLDDGILKTIRREMAQQFPSVQPPAFDGAAGFVTYGYLDTKVRFTTPFDDTKRPIEFSDATGVKHSVSGFGPHEGTDWDLQAKQVAQVKVLFSQADDPSNPFRPTAFALDLTADQAEQAVILAVLPRAEHLQAALNDLTQRIDKFAPSQDSAELTETDALAVPNVAFHVQHAFAELQGVDKCIENPGKYQGLYVWKAYQSISYRLDKSGAAVASESYMYPAAIPREFIVNRPFLIVMKRRSADQPYFVAWIENTELLQVSPGGS